MENIRIMRPVREYATRIMLVKRRFLMMCGLIALAAVSLAPRALLTVMMLATYSLPAVADSLPTPTETPMKYPTSDYSSPVPIATLIKSTQSTPRVAAIKRFIAQCDKSINGGRISGNPYKFVGKKVCLYGSMDSIIDESHWDLTATAGQMGLADTNDVLIIGDARSFEKGDGVYVQGIVLKPTHAQNTSGGSDTYAVVQAKFVESSDEYQKKELVCLKLDDATIARHAQEYERAGANWSASGEGTEVGYGGDCDYTKK